MCNHIISLGVPVGVLTAATFGSFAAIAATAASAAAITETGSVVSIGVGALVGAAGPETDRDKTPYTFRAGIQDGASGLAKFGIRWYNPTTGTWTQQDTLDAHLNPKNANRYAYVGGDPINNIDPTGQNTGSDIANNLFAGYFGAVVGTVVGGTCAGIATAAAPVTAGVSLGAYVGCGSLGFLAGGTFASLIHGPF